MEYFWIFFGYLWTPLYTCLTSHHSADFQIRSRGEVCGGSEESPNLSGPPVQNIQTTVLVLDSRDWDTNMEVCLPPSIRVKWDHLRSTNKIESIIHVVSNSWAQSTVEIPRKLNNSHNKKVSCQSFNCFSVYLTWIKTQNTPPRIVPPDWSFVLILCFMSNFDVCNWNNSPLNTINTELVSSDRTEEWGDRSIRSLQKEIISCWEI